MIRFIQACVSLLSNFDGMLSADCLVLDIVFGVFHMLGVDKRVCVSISMDTCSMVKELISPETCN